jgi:dihydropteroate synthase
MTIESPTTWNVSSTRAVHADRPCLFGILNCTPDSFSDGGQLGTLVAVVSRASDAQSEGADLLDIGGESTRPGASRVEESEQIKRVIPAIRAIRDAGIELPITVDTTLHRVASAALDAGADAINDVSAGSEDDSMLQLAGDRGCGIILMHRLAPPGEDRYSDQYETAPRYDDVVAQVSGYLHERAELAMSRGVEPGAIMIDPGLGFGKSVEQNLALIRRTDELCALGYPVLSAASRKSFVGRITHGRDSEPLERVEGSIACSILHLMAGARHFRVHDVGLQRRAIDAAWAILESRRDPSE